MRHVCSHEPLESNHLMRHRYYNLLPPKAPRNTHQDTSTALEPSMDLGLSWKGNLRLRLRLPIGPGNPEISFGNPARSQIFLQLYGDEGV